MSSVHRHLGDAKNVHRPTPLNLEQLEARMLMAVDAIDHALHSLITGDEHQWPVVGATTVGSTARSSNAPPTLAQPITVAGGNTIRANSAALSVLGRDDQSASLLTYTWSVVSAPAGGRATFNVNGNNAARNTTVNFTKPGAYDLRVTIQDRGGGRVVANSRVTVVPNAAPTIARAISVAGGSTVTGSTASVSVLGQDDRGESQLTYTWTVASAPAGGRATFSTNGNNAAKNTQVAFSTPGNYRLTVTILDRDGARVTSTAQVTVRAALTVQSGGSQVANNSTLTVTSSQTTLTSSLAARWTQVSAPAGGTSQIRVSGNNATITFTAAGLYRYTAVQGTTTLTFSINVQSTLTSITLTPGTGSLQSGGTQQFTAVGRDQFNKVMSVTPSWSTTSGSISRTGLLTAPGSQGSLTVRATQGQVTGTATMTVTAPSPINNTNLRSLVTTLFADGSLNRTDVMQILRSAGSDGIVDATELSDLRYIVANAVTYAMPGYVQVLASNVVNGNAANATYQGTAAGNLAAGSSGALLTKLVDKWFLGTDLPTITGSGISYKTATGPLFVSGTASFNDQLQGQLGDCYFIAALAAIAGRNPTAVANMFVDNGDGTFTVRFFTGSYSMFYNSDGSISDGFAGGSGTADYVTVNRQLPAYSNNTFAYSNYGRSITSPTTALWIALAEKAYAQWNQTGKANRNGTNSYASIEGGWMGTVNAQVLGVNSASYIMSNATSQVLINALAAGRAVTIGTKGNSGNGLVGSHAYTITSYNATNQTFALFNPWGMMHPPELTWAQLQANTTWMTVANPVSSPIVTSVRVAAPSVKGLASDQFFAPIDTLTIGTSSNGLGRNDSTLNPNIGGQVGEQVEQTELRDAQLAVSTAELKLQCDSAMPDARCLTPAAVDLLFAQLDLLLDELSTIS